LHSGKFAVALEITPPLRPARKLLVRRASLIGECAQAINVIQRSGRQSSLDASITLTRAGIEPVWHLAVRGCSRDELRSSIARASANGVRNVLCLRGDHGAPDLPDTPSIRDTIGMVRHGIPGGLVGATLNQYGHNPEATLGNLLPKLRAGAAYAQTQPVFDLHRLAPLAQHVRAQSPATRIVAMVMPLVSLDSVARIESRLGIELGDAVRARIAAGEDGAWRFFRDVIASLVESPLIDGVAIMTFETDAPPAMGERIEAALREAGALS